MISLLSSFLCPLNPDVEHFLHYNAINFSKQGIAITYLVFVENEDSLYFVGYFALTNKIIQFEKMKMSNRTERLVKRFGDFDEATNTYSLSAPLIAHFGKNFSANQKLLSFYQPNGYTVFGKRYIQNQSETEPKHFLFQLVKFLK